VAPAHVLAGRYELGAPIGSGGFATVYRARDVTEGTEVAVKVIPLAFAAPAAALASGGGGGTATRVTDEDPAQQFDRFRQEALALSRLRSRHVARVFDFGRDATIGMYIVMELIDGVPLELRALGRALMPHEVLRVARGVLAGLAEAHGHGIVHRDVKPSNVIVPRGKNGLDQPRLLDFGIAREAKAPAPAPTSTQRGWCSSSCWGSAPSFRATASANSSWRASRRTFR
jgi:serine/threonine-protein kinase